MRATAVIGIVVALMVPPRLAVAELAFITGSELRKQCTAVNEAQNSPQWFGCIGYVIGIADVMAVTPVAGFSVCLPSNATRVQAALVVRRFLDSNPEMLHHGAAALVVDALARAFPCTQR